MRQEVVAAPDSVTDLQGHALIYRAVARDELRDARAQDELLPDMVTHCRQEWIVRFSPRLFCRLALMAKLA